MLVMKPLLLQLLSLYRNWISPAIHAVSPSGCRYHPTCSQYASDAIAMHGPSRGSWLAFLRLMRCHPFGRGGFDPVPLPGLSTPGHDSAATRPDPLP